MALDYRINVKRRKFITEKGEYILPFGLAHYFKRDDFKDYTLKETNSRVRLECGDRKIVVHPRFKKNYKGKKNEVIEVFEVLSDVERNVCKKMILEEHYLQPPNRGVYVAARQNNKLIGCYVIDELNHGNPKIRMQIDEDLTVKEGWADEEWAKVPRAEVKSKLGLVWMSRIAIAKKFQNKGIGTILAKSAVELLKQHHPASPRHLEVIATYPKTNESTVDIVNTIFSKSGYSSCFMTGITHEEIDKKSGNFVPIKAERYYFWIEI